MGTATVVHDPTIGTFDVTFKAPKFGIIADAVGFIKIFIPACDRSYDKITKTWTIDAKHWAACEETFKEYFRISASEKPKPKYSHEDFFYNHAPAPRVETRETIAAKLETLLSISITTTPFDELKRAYRRKALELHPDRNNGDGSKMSELNAAWTIYNKN